MKLFLLLAVFPMVHGQNSNSASCADTSRFACHSIDDCRHMWCKLTSSWQGPCCDKQSDCLCDPKDAMPLKAGAVGPTRTTGTTVPASNNMCGMNDFSSILTAMQDYQKIPTTAACLASALSGQDQNMIRGWCQCLRFFDAKTINRLNHCKVGPLHMDVQSIWQSCADNGFDKINPDKDFKVVQG